MFPDVFSMSETFGISPEEILDILLVGYTKTKFIRKTIYHNPSWYKDFTSAYSYGIITLEEKTSTWDKTKVIERTLFFVKDENSTKEIYQLEKDITNRRKLLEVDEEDLPF